MFSLFDDIDVSVGDGPLNAVIITDVNVVFVYLHQKHLYLGSIGKVMYFARCITNQDKSILLDSVIGSELRHVLLVDKDFLVLSYIVCKLDAVDGYKYHIP